MGAELSIWAQSGIFGLWWGAHSLIQLVPACDIPPDLVVSLLFASSLLLILVLVF